MLRFYTLIGLILMTWAQVFGQGNPASGADSLEKRLTEDLPDSSRTRVLSKLVNRWIYDDADKAMLYARQIMDLGRKSGTPYALANGYEHIGRVFLESNRLDSGEIFLKKALDLFKKDTSVRSRSDLARTWHNYGALMQRKGNVEEYLDILLKKVAPVFEKLQDTLLLANTDFDIGIVFMNQQQYDKALQYYDKAIKGASPVQGAQGLLAQVYLYACRVLIMTRDFREEKVAKAGSYLEKAQAILRSHPSGATWIMYCLIKGAFLHEMKDDMEGALKSFDEGLMLARKTNQHYAELELLNKKFYLYFDNRQYVKAKAIAYELDRKDRESPIEGSRLVNLKNLIDVEEKTGNIPGAFHLLKDYTAKSDSIQKEETTRRLLEMEKKYQVEKRQNEINRLTAENKLGAASLRYSKTLLYFSMGILCSLLALLLMGYRLFRNKQEIARQQQTLHNEQIERVQQDQKLRFFNAMIMGQEQERKRLAGDLHDGLGGLLANIKLQYSRQEPNHNDRKVELLEKMDAASNELRRIARNMMPETLLRIGLLAALKDFCHEVEYSGIQVTLQAYDLKEIEDDNQKIMLYRILQELITNAVKHAKARHILVQCIQDGNKMFITVEDDGIGFADEPDKPKEGIGLSNIKNRVAYLKGHLEISSEKNIGTSVNIEFEINATLQNKTSDC